METNLSENEKRFERLKQIREDFRKDLKEALTDQPDNIEYVEWLRGVIAGLGIALIN